MIQKQTYKNQMPKVAAAGLSFENMRLIPFFLQELISFVDMNVVESKFVTGES